VQTGPKRQMAWFASDTPVTSVYVPLFARVSAISSPYATGHNQEFTRASASWAFNFVSNYMQLNYRGMSEDDVYPAIKKWQNNIDGRLSDFEAADDKALAKMQIDLQEDVVADWWKLADFLVMKYNDGKVNWPKAGKSIGYPEQFSRMIGFNNDVHPNWVNGVEAPLVTVDGYVPRSVRMPMIWHSATATWTYATDLATQAVSTSDLQLFLLQFFITCFALTLGVALGRGYERRNKRSPDHYLSLM